MRWPAMILCALSESYALSSYETLQWIRPPICQPGISPLGIWDCPPPPLTHLAHDTYTVTGHGCGRLKAAGL